MTVTSINAKRQNILSTLTRAAEHYWAFILYIFTHSSRKVIIFLSFFFLCCHQLLDTIHNSAPYSMLCDFFYGQVNHISVIKGKVKGKRKEKVKTFQLNTVQGNPVIMPEKHELEQSCMSRSGWIQLSGSSYFKPWFILLHYSPLFPFSLFCWTSVCIDNSQSQTFFPLKFECLGVDFPFPLHMFASTWC